MTKNLKRDFPILIFSNIVNNLMIGKVDQKYGESLNIVTPREIWLAQEGDILVSCNAINAEFKTYACDLLGIEEQKVNTLSYEGNEEVVLADRIINDKEALDQLKTTLSQYPDIKMLAFAHDNSTLALAKELGIELMDYDEFPNDDLIESFYYINTKNGFKNIAESLDIKVAPGIYADSVEQLLEQAPAFLEEHKKIVFKFNRSSNGYGILILNESDFEDDNFIEFLKYHINKFDDQPKEFILEKFIEFKDIPSIELIVDNKSSNLLYLCNQFCVNYSWSGMITPPLGLEKEVHQSLDEIGEKFGKYIHKLGFRGICDVDCGISESNEIYATESNFRRTGGTYTDLLVRRLYDDNYYENNSCYWIANVKEAEENSFSTLPEALTELKNLGILFDSENNTGVILTYYTYPKDKKWRYLIIEKTVDGIKKTEHRLLEALKILN
ncbi:peptide ligase PGM1-related protein [Aquimarina sp. RZ0]|uniref:preATP grasp domain-containing protein n=1 Tax=Aquimarina sp. RZ0 TaxID=2607730 RepID=UPI0011F27037|nr:peptide ligase PGM1-related protein [Aquimarina sp. RZ0]KAA1243801.1 hypothetical protein F0000_19410 [Aquimarina sp. RZ0]